MTHCVFHIQSKFVTLRNSLLNILDEGASQSCYLGHYQSSKDDVSVDGCVSVFKQKKGTDYDRSEGRS
jgi:hypothetical protein